MSENGRSKIRVLSVLVEDHPGVLTRVGGLIMRRGFNIHALSVGPSDVPGRSRMTLSVDAGHAETDQVGKQLDKLVEVIYVTDLTDNEVLARELAIARVAVALEERADLIDEMTRLGARLVDAGTETLVFELTADRDTVERFVELLRPHRIHDLARSGPVAIRRRL